MFFGPEEKRKKTNEDTVCRRRGEGPRYLSGPFSRLFTLPSRVSYLRACLAKVFYTGSSLRSFLGGNAAKIPSE